MTNNETFVYHFKKYNKKFDLYLRTFKGDIDIFYEVFWKKTYDKHLNYIQEKPKVILDLGAHIGMTSIYLSMKYPDAKIIAVEASAENFIILKENIKAFENIECMNAAIYFKDGTVNFSNEELSYNQKISETGTRIQAISVESLMEKYDISKIDLLKIDIEGGEVELLRKNNLWLEKVENIIIEIHQDYTKEDLYNDLIPFNFKIKHNENAVLFADKK